MASTPESTVRPLLLSVSEFARAIGIGRTKAFQLISDGTVETVTIGSRRLVPIDAAEAFVARLRSADDYVIEG